jgi:uncharacterized protein GlcG (DUF336 family)
MRKLLLPLLLALPVSVLAQAQAPAAPPPPPAPGPALADALLAAQAAVKACQERQQNVSVAVVDSAGVHKLLLAGDGAHQRGVQSSTAKALTALAFKLPTSALAERAKQDVALGARLAADSGYNSRAGGLPIVKDGVVIGAIGVGGARGSENDEACAKAGLERIGVRTALLPSEAAALGVDRLVQHLP